MKPYRSRFVVLLLISLLLHLLLYILLSWLPNQERIIPEDKTVRISLKTKEAIKELPEEPKKDELKEEVSEEAEQEKLPKEEKQDVAVEDAADAVPAPVDNADEVASNNQDDESKNEIVLGEMKSEPKELQRPEEQFDVNKEVIEKSHISKPAEEKDVKVPPPKTEQALEQQKPLIKDVLTSSHQQADAVEEVFEMPSYMDVIDYSTGSEDLSKLEPDVRDQIFGEAQMLGEEWSSLDRPADYLDRPGNLHMLSDPNLKEITGEQPFSESKSKELKLANAFLERMNKQVYALWVNPYKGGHNYRGVIRFELDLNGYLLDSRIYRRSGHPILDASVLKAIRAVKRFEVPKNKNIVNSYYRNLRFHYNSVEAKTELMPFEAEPVKDDKQQNQKQQNESPNEN